MNYMVQLHFFLRFKSQLRRTRPDLISRLENSLAKAVENAGGKITGERRLLTASFDGQSLGFWLDMLILIETLLKNVEAAAADLYGYSLVLGQNLPASQDVSPEALCRFLAGGGGGVFLDRGARDRLLPYVDVEGSGAWLGTRSPGKAKQFGAIGPAIGPAGGFFRLIRLKVFAAATNKFPLQEAIVRALGKQETAGQQRNVLVLGPASAGKRNGLYRYCAAIHTSGAEIGGDMPPLPVRFGAGGINALIDAWTPQIRALPGAAETVEEINSLWDLLFRERLRDELSPFVIRKARCFFSLLLDFYISAARSRGRTPILVLEHIHQAEDMAAEIFIDTYTSLKNTRGLLALGSCDEGIGDENLRKWERIFPRVIKLGNGVPQSALPEMPPELWEIGYALSLFSRYYPVSLFQRLFEEEEKNPAMIFRALTMLSALAVIDSPQDPRPLPARFAERAEAALGENAGRIKALVRNRLLGWVAQRKLSPCFRLLTILAALDGSAQLTDALILKSISSDLINGTTSAIDRACENGLLEKLAGPARAAAVSFICETTRALLSGKGGEIRAAFKDPPPDCAAFPVMKAQVLANLSACHLGLRDNSSALETVKEAILLSQGANKLCLPQSYRLFSLVSLSQQKTGETIDYLGFAVESAEKSGNYHELGVSAYYAAAAQFLFGNVSRAAQLARKAREQALAAGRPEWADRSRFLEGRLVFEIGRYQEAQELFEKLRKAPAGGSTPEKDQLLAAWAYRARVYFQNPLCPKPPDGGSDADLFEVEAAYLAGNYRKAAELSGILTNPHTEDNFLYTEQPDWRSGFAQCEHLYFSRGELWERMICVYHSLAICNLSASGGEEAIHNMQRILRNEQLSEMDPWDAFYFYAWYRILERTGAGQVDMNTAVSMAFKRLQRRASRIDDIETRRQYLNQPRWNSALSLAAKEFKLI
ncbi:hypothetical protein AGMMS50293_24590 [Spirochaetia bacterium]|nr:hypothetical protein AGMMS50293_24590 [Spirochaetia bacterium]